MKNRQIHLVSRPTGEAEASCFALVDTEVDGVRDGDVLTRNLYLSVDPYMRGRMGGGVGYAGGFALNEVIPARVVAEVLESRNPRYTAGDLVWGFLGWEDHTLVRAGAGLRTVDANLGPISHAISVRGMPGLTAEVGLVDIGQPRPGDTVFVSAATGAVGQIVGQLARRAGCRVVGSCGSEKKVRHAQESLGYHGAFNYLEEEPSSALERLCPDGIDIYFDNVGGDTLDAALARLNAFARVPICGQISQYSQSTPTPLSNLGRLLGCRATMTGFVIYDHMHKFEAFEQRMARLVADGRVIYHEDIMDGLERAPEAFLGMMRGDNLGKRLVRLG